MSPIPPRTSGIYQIRCIPTGKIYVGSAVNLRVRWRDHCRKLHLGEHINLHLQNAWNKYGEENFEFSVLEFVEEPDLLKAEQSWIDGTNCVDKNIGFNICPIAGYPGGLNIQVWEGFVNPDGNEITITNLQAFCREHNLDFPSMHRLAMGKSKLKSYKGWTHKNSVRQRDYIKTHEGYINPYGVPVEPIVNLAEFCREHGLDATHMVAVAKGRICSHQGWTHVDGRQRSQRVYTGFINPEGQRMTITNLTEFCRHNDVHPVKMFELISGKRRIHKGWTWREDNE